MVFKKTILFSIFFGTFPFHAKSLMVQVMGRHCGYLALVAGVVTEADFVFVPEVFCQLKSFMERNFQWPPESNWPEMLCAKLGGERKTGQVNHLKLNCSSLFCCLSQRLNIIIVSEGAIDRDGNPITADAVKKVLLDKH